jgi:hypothetical protein
MSRVLWKPNTNYRLHNIPPLGLIINDINSAHNHQSHFKIHVNITSIQLLHLTNCFLLSKFHTKTLYALLFPPFRATYPAHPINLYLPTLICDEQHNSCRSLSQTYTHPLVTSFPLVPKYSSRPIVPKHPKSGDLRSLFWLPHGVDCGLRGPNPGREEIFHTRPNRTWGPPNLLYNGYRVSLPGG